MKLRAYLPAARSAHLQIAGVPTGTSRTKAK
jgi:hypothetical protein